MGDAATVKAKKWESHDVRFLSTLIKVEAQVPTADALTFPSYRRRRYGCRLIDWVEPAGTFSVYIYATDCTAVEAVREYIEIVNKYNGSDENETYE